MEQASRSTIFEAAEKIGSRPVSHRSQYSLILVLQQLRYGQSHNLIPMTTISRAGILPARNSQEHERVTLRCL